MLAPKRFPNNPSTLKGISILTIKLHFLSLCFSKFSMYVIHFKYHNIIILSKLEKGIQEMHVAVFCILYYIFDSSYLFVTFSFLFNHNNKYLLLSISLATCLLLFCWQKDIIMKIKCLTRTNEDSRWIIYFIYICSLFFLFLIQDPI